MATQDQISQSMIEQLRALDSSISAEVGTPERRIIDTVAQAIADAQVDLNLLQGAFDIESKFGPDLDNMLSILGFGRQSGRRATGYITFSRNSASTSAVIIPTGTTVFTPSGGDGNVSVTFRTTTSGRLEIGSTSVVVPIEAVQPGTIGNVAAGTITETVGTPVYGITSVVNEYATTGGQDQESDSELKARFTTAGPFRNLAGTYDQFMSLALSTVSKKANVVGPISKYSEYIQIPSTFDGDGGNGNAGDTHAFTTALSNNANSKHIYKNVPYFVIDNTGASPVYYTANYDYVLNTTPEDKNRGDAYRQSSIIDPTSTELPVLYQPNVTFTNVYTGSADTKPTNALSPEDVLLFEHSYMSTASRNDYYNNVLNCVDVYVNGNDIKTASATIPRPGNSVPTFTFNETSTSAFYVDNFRRVGESGHRPISGNIFTPLYNQPITELPDRINLTNCWFTKGIHYWLVEEVTSLYGTVRARNGIEWSTTIKGQTSVDATDGPYTGEYINNTISSAATLKVALPSSTSVSTTMDTLSYTVTNKVAASSVATLTIGSHSLKAGDTVSVAGVDGTFNKTSVVLTAVGSTTISYALSATVSSTSSGGTVTLLIIKSSNTTPIKVSSTAAFPNTGYILIGSEILQYTGKTSTQFTIDQRGAFGTTPAAITASSSTTVNVLIEIQANTTTQLPSTDWILIDSEIIKYTKPPGASDSLLQLVTRADQGSYQNSHIADATISLLLQTVDRSVLIDSYQYDDNIVALQALLEANKQVTTDVLAHKAKVRYFKPDVTVMYAPGVNRASVNDTIRNALVNFFDTIYFGSEIQLSDIIQTIHNVAGVDNVRWSKDVLETNNQGADSSGDARPRLVETDQYGNPVSQPVLDLVKIGDGTTATTYNLYLPYLTSTVASVIKAPTNLTASLTSGSGSTTYYYVVTALTENGETTKSDEISVSSAGTTGTITLSWSPVKNATGYRIYRNTTSNAWTTGALLVDEAYESDSSYIDDVSVATEGDIPKSVNTATFDLDKTQPISNFRIQYGQYEPVEIQYDDFLIQLYDPNITYGKGEVVLYGSKYYVSKIDDNQGSTPSSLAKWTEDTVNKIAFTAKINQSYNLITATNTNNFVFSPSFNNRIVITYNSMSAKDKLSIVDTNVNVGYGVYNSDFQIGDDELASLPVGALTNGTLDLSTMITIREKSQNTWNSVQ